MQGTSVRSLCAPEMTGDGAGFHESMRETIAALLRLSLEPYARGGQLRQALELVVSGPSLTPLRAAALYLIDGDAGRLFCKETYGEDRVAEIGAVAVGRCVCGRPIDPQELFFERRIVDSVSESAEESSPGGHYCIPIMSEERQIGLLHIRVGAGHQTSPEIHDFLLSAADVLAGIIGRGQVEESLRRSEERFDLAVKGTQAGIWDWNLETNEAYFSPRWKEMLGFAEDELCSDFDAWRERIHPDDQDQAEATIAACLAGAVADFEVEHRLRHRDGTYRWIIARGATRCDATGRPTRFVGTQIDVTDRKRTELALRDREARLLAARRIQQRLLPQSAPDFHGLDLAGVSVPAEFTGGDSFDYLHFPDQTLGLVIADVSGHGFDSALLMATASARLRAYAESPMGLSEIVRRTNRALAGETEGDRFITMLIAQVDPRDHTLRFVNAGHPPGYLFRANGEIKAVLESPSLPLAVLPDATFPVGGPIPLDPGDVLLLLTDGLTDPYSDGVAAFGIDNVLSEVRSRLELPSQQILTELLESIRDYREALDCTDDVTAVVMRYTPDVDAS